MGMVNEGKAHHAIVLCYHAHSHKEWTRADKDATFTSPLPLPLQNPLLPSLKATAFRRRSVAGVLAVRCRTSSDYFHSQPPFSPPTPAGLGAKVFVGYSIYKGKAALTVEPRPPEFVPLDSGAYKVSKEGFVLLQFAPAVAARQYDWNRKQVFSLSVTEVGTLVGLGAKDSCEFFHDPFKGKSEEGKVRKLLKAEPLPDGSGHFFNLSVQNRLVNVDESIYIPVSKAEFIVLVSAFNFILPYLLGWHAFANSTRLEDSARSNNASSRSGAELEWRR